MNDYKRKVIIDFMDEYFFESKTEINSDNFRYANSLHDVINSLRLLWQTKNFTIIYKPHDGEIEKVLELVNATGNVTLIIEEIHLLSKSTQSNLYRILTTGRHKNINVIATAQRPYRVSRDLTAQSDIIISFRQTEKRDIDYLTEFSDEAGTLSEKLRKLRTGKFIVIQE